MDKCDHQEFNPTILKPKYLNWNIRQEIDPFKTKYLIYRGFWKAFITTEGYVWDWKYNSGGLSVTTL